MGERQDLAVAVQDVSLALAVEGLEPVAGSARRDDAPADLANLGALAPLPAGPSTVPFSAKVTKGSVSGTVKAVQAGTQRALSLEVPLPLTANPAKRGCGCGGGGVAAEALAGLVFGVMRRRRRQVPAPADKPGA